MTVQLIASIALIGSVAWGSFELGKEINQGEVDAKAKTTKEAQDKALDAAARAIAQLNVTQQTIVQRVTRETIEKPVYRDCVNDPGVMRDINAAIESTGAVELPASSPAD